MAKPIIKRVVDFLMTVALLLLMSYSLIGEAAHEWIGMGMFLLFTAHLILNRKWVESLGRGRWPAYRMIQTALVVLCFLTMVGSVASGIILSNYIFVGLRIQGWSALARQTHLLCSYWGFLLMSLHLGLHWSMILTAARRFSKVFQNAVASVAWLADSGLWSLRTLETGTAGVPVSANTLCIF